ncbi:beta-glucosidase, partial [Bifidobacterium longum]
LYVMPILDGLNEPATSHPSFASKVTAAATRVMALKIKMGLA